MATNFPVIGDLFAGRFRVVGTLGEGGFATVFDAQDANGARVALKVLKPERGGYDDQLLRRFEREVRTLSQLRSPHTVRLLAHGRSPDGAPYAVFEHLDGEELAQVLARRGALSGPEVEHVVRQLLDALDDAHRRGLLHRDLKPENIIVRDRDGDPLTITLIDFGIARPLEGGGPALTKTGELIGTPRYMSPEQLTERPLTAASDVYSLGLIAFEMVAGRDALHGGALGDQLGRLLDELEFGGPGFEALEPRMRSVIRKMATRAPAERFQTAAAVLSALDGRAAAPATQSTPVTNRALVLVAAAVITLAVALAAIVSHMFSSPGPTATIPRSYSKQATAAPQPVATPLPPRLADVQSPVDASEVPPVAEYGSDGCSASMFPDRGAIHGRDSSVFLPHSVDPRTAVPLVILLHDKGQSPRAFMKGSGFMALATEHEFVLFAPRTLRRHRNEEDSTLTNSILDDFVRDHCVDLTRIFVVGHGHGGRVAEIASCRPWVAGVAMNSHMPKEFGEPCRAPLTPRPIPTLMIIPRDSKHHTPFGGTNCGGDPDSPFELSETSWAHAHTCEASDERFKVGETANRCRDWSCEVPFRSCMLVGGHPWPGFEGRTAFGGDPKGCDGKAPDFDTARVMWEFFAESMSATRQSGNAPSTRSTSSVSEPR